MRYERVVCALAVGCVCSLFAFAEDAPPPPPGQPAPEQQAPAQQAPAQQGVSALGLNEAQRKAVITENIAFGKDEADGFWPLYRDYRRDIAKLQDQRARAITLYADVFRSMTADQAKSILEDVLQADEGISKVKREYQKKIGKVLPQTKLTRFFVIDAKIDLAGQAVLMTRVPTAEPKH